MRRFVERPILTTIVIALASMFSAHVASAHVVVSPRQSQMGAYERYVVRVPTEGKVATTSIELTIPATATFISIGVATGHSYELKKSEGRVVGIVWSMQINPGEFAEFSFMARNPKDGTELVWKAVQRFADGTSAHWIGPRGDKRPASTTTLSPGDSGHTH